MKKDHQNKYKTKRELMSNRRKRKRIVLSTDLEESDSSSSSASSTVKKRSKKSTRRNSFSSLTSSTSTSSYLTSPSSSSESGSTCSSSSSSSSDDNKTRKRKNKEIIKKKLKEKRLVEKQKRRKRRLKRRRRKIVKNWNVNNVTISSTDEHEKNDHKGKKKESVLAFEKNIDEKSTTNDVPLGLMYKKTAITPMTKEEWDKKQSVVRRVYDEETGRHRLIKGDGEVLEEIISKERHKEINRQATIGDGEYFSKKISQSVK